MEFNLVMCFIVVIFTVIGMIVMPWLKRKGLWVATLFAVNMAEQMFNYVKAGAEKYVWVDNTLKMLLPKLTDEERKQIIEEVVNLLNSLKGE